MTQAQAIAAQIKEAVSVVWRHRFVVAKAFGLLLALSLAIVAVTPRIYRAAATVLIVNGNSRNDPTLSSPDIPALVTSTSVLAEVQKKLDLTVPLLTLKNGVTAKPPPFKSSLMRIEYSDRIPERAAIIANAVADELASHYNQLSTARFDDDLRSLDGELVKQKTRIGRLDERIRVAANTQPSAGQNSADASSADQLNTLETQRTLASAGLQGDLAQAEALTTDARARSSMSLHDILEADPVYRALQLDAGAASAQLAEARAQYTDSHPSLLALQAKVHSIALQLSRHEARARSSPHTLTPSEATARLAQRKMEAVVAADRFKVDALDREIARISRQQDGAAPLAFLRLERDSAMTEYRAIASHRESTLLDRGDALSLGSVVVVDRALGSQAQAVGIGPRKLSVMLFVASIVLALGCAFLAEQLNPRLRRAAQIENLYGKPVVATLEKCR